MQRFQLNDLLREANVPVERTRLVRHQDKRGPAQRTPYHPRGRFLHC